MIKSAERGYFMKKKTKLKEYYFYKGTYKEISYESVRNFRQEAKFKVGSISVEVYYSPEIRDERRKKRMNEYLEDFIKEESRIEDAMINLSMLQNVKVSCSAEWCKKRLKIFIRSTP